MPMQRAGFRPAADRPCVVRARVISGPAGLAGLALGNGRPRAGAVAAKPVAPGAVPGWNAHSRIAAASFNMFPPGESRGCLPPWWSPPRG